MSLGESLGGELEAEALAPPPVAAVPDALTGVSSALKPFVENIISTDLGRCAVYAKEKAQKARSR